MSAAALFLTAALVPQAQLAVETIHPDRGPRVLLHAQPGPVVALRLSAPVPVDLPEGSVELLQELARPAAEAAAYELGARLELRHERGRAVIAVAGPSTAFDALVAVLRRATGEPDLTVAALRRARARTEDRTLAGLEQPGPRLRRLLRHRLYGGSEPRGATAARLDPEAVRGLRARLYDPSRLHVSMVGSVPMPVLRSAFADWPAAERASDPDPSSGDDVDRAQPQAHREWGGIAYPVEADPAVLAVAAALVRRRVARSALRYGVVEAWLEPSAALVLLGAATPGDSVVRASAGISDLTVRDDAPIPVTDVRRYLRRLIAEAAALVGREAVAEARTAVRRQLLLEARTVPGKAEVIGRVTEAVGPDVDGDAYLERLARVTLDDVRELLARVLSSPAVVAEAG